MILTGINVQHVILGTILGFLTPLPFNVYAPLLLVSNTMGIYYVNFAGIIFLIVIHAITNLIASNATRDSLFIPFLQEIMSVGHVLIHANNVSEPTQIVLNATLVEN